MMHDNLADIDADVLADIAHFPSGDPLLELKNDEQRTGARLAAQWILQAVDRDGIAVKILALRFLFGLEPRSMAVVAKKYGVTRQAISKQCNALADALRIPHLRSETLRDNYRRAQLTAWRKRKAKLHGDNGQI